MVETPSLSEVEVKGRARIDDSGPKEDTVRTAVAAARVLLGDEAFEQLRTGQIAKGDVFTTAQVAGIQAAKQTSHLIPLCNNVMLQGIDIQIELNENQKAVEIRAVMKTVGQVGVEMEALTAVSLASLTVYDMCKSVSKEIQITGIRLLAKTGGQSGDYRRHEQQ